MSNKIEIIILSGPSAGDVFRFTLVGGGEVVIGRALESNIVLQESTVSRKHAKIFKKGEYFFIADMGSSLGTVHMGFNLSPGDENARQIISGDEFKIGEQIFRFKRESEEPAGRKKLTLATPKRNSNSLVEIVKKQKYLVLVALVAVLLLLVFQTEEPSIPAGKDNDVLSVPRFNVVGYWPTDNPSEQNFSRREKIQFDVPPTDLLLEYSYASQGEVQATLEGFEFAKLSGSTGFTHRAAIIRGVSTVDARKLVFANSSKENNWAFKNVRVTPLTIKEQKEDLFVGQIDEAISLVEGIDKTPEGLFLLLRSLQLVDLILIKELKIDVQDIKIETSASRELLDFSNLSALRQRLEVLKNERIAQDGTNRAKEHQNEVTNLVSQIDTELWRRLNSRINQAKLAAKISNSIEAHDLLLSAQGMFLNESDYRWTIANRLLNDNTIVPKKIRDNPNKYRKNKI
ncbi:MAG: FHA domain-containing protein [Proteobacteria bacterium]|nr:FHA domain-containing protein [Pseudomonadota bacterium]